MNPIYRPWTYNDIDILKRDFPVKPTEAVARELNRSARAVSVMAHKLGLKKSNYGIVWTGRMVKLLTDYFPIMFNDAVAKLVGVSVRSAIRKARELGLEKRPGFLEDRRRDIGERIRDAKRRNPCYAGCLKKGEHRNPEGEFKKGHVESPESKAKRIASKKETERRKREAARRKKIYGF